MGGLMYARQNGVALVMVMWLVAAMSLLVASVVYVARMDVKQQQLDQELIAAGAQADKAMRMAVREFTIESEAGEVSKQLAQEYSWQDSGSVFRVELFPSSGLIHLGSLTPEMLLSVLQYGAGVDQDKLAAMSELLAGGFSSVALGESDKSLPARFRVLEDLMLIPGVTVDDYETLKNYFYVGQLGSPGINPAAAPRELLSILAGGDESAVDEFLQLRLDASGGLGSPVLPHPQFDPGLLSSADSSTYRVDVTVQIGSKQKFKRRYWLSMMPSQLGLPWTELSREEARVESKNKSRDAV